MDVGHPSSVSIVSLAPLRAYFAYLKPAPNPVEVGQLDGEAFGISKFRIFGFSEIPTQAGEAGPLLSWPGQASVGFGNRVVIVMIIWTRDLFSTLRRSLFLI